ncbi:EAL domain-containing protein [Aquabacterium sp.]|uniref:sensor domain-containing protein n=1 Tax=Aquabacterium sp. TaxID=1872578 RepID=UPI0025BD8DE2|nr:EAL domain-containing protein [Aquabacterium sp.]
MPHPSPPSQTPATQAAAVAALPMPALGRFGPLALSVGALAAISMGLIAWSHLGWNRLQQQAHAFDTHLSAARFEARQAQWLLGSAPEPSASGQPASLITPLTRAHNALAALQPHAPEAVKAPLSLLQTQVVAALRQAETAPQDAGMRDAIAAMDQALSATSTQWEQALERATRDQHHLDRLNVALVGCVTLMLLVLMGRAHRQRELAIDKVKAREAQLSAFAEALPDLAFRMDAEGHYLDIYGNNLPLLGRPAHELIGRRLSDLFPPDMAQRFLGVLQQTLGSRSTQAITFNVTINQELRHFDSRCAPVGDTDQVVWMIWDITGRRQTERRLRRKTRMYDFLSHVNQAIVRSDDQATLMNRVCRVAVRHGQFRKAWVALFDAHTPGALHCVAEAGDERPLRPSLSFALSEAPQADHALDTALRQGLTFRTRDLRAVPQQGPHPAWLDEAVAAGTPGCVIVPLRREQTLIGHLLLLGRRVDDTDADELGLFEDLSSDLSFAVTNLHREALRDQAEERIRLHAAALESTRDGMMVLDSDRVLVSINPAFTALTGYEEHEVIGRSPEFLLTDAPDEFVAQLREHLLSYGSWQGEVWFRHRNGDPFMTKLSVAAVHSTQGEPSHFVGVFTDITQLKQTEERLARMAHYDPLTELPNRVLIRQRLAHAINLAQRHHTQVGVVFIDLDNFKTVNDGLGHAAGDSLLKQVAQRLRQRVREEDTLGRLAGDEFVLVLEHLRHPQQAAHVATAILETLNQPFTLDGGQQVYVRASIGISMYPDDGQDESELVRNADAAMYESKRRGRNNFSFYTQAFTAEATLRLQMETLLRRAVEHSEFTLHYQPMVRLSDRKVIALEALVRLNTAGQHTAGTHSGSVTLSPNQFIPVMEDTGMITSLSEWVIEEACRQGRAWLDAGLDFGRVAINLSPSEIRRGGVVERLAEILVRTGLPPQYLEIEITEGGLMESGMGAEQFLQHLHQLGVFLTIDDFGTGYSSLAYLKRFPVQQLKIDRSFVQDLPSNDNDSQLVSTMISMAHGLRLHVVAEGVEMPDQEAFLCSLGCDVAQGYLYSRPVPAAQISQMLTRH